VLTYEFVCGQEPFGADTTHDTRRELFNTRRGAQTKSTVVQSRICRCDVRFPAGISRDAQAFILEVIRTAGGMVSRAYSHSCYA
jgi:hypothetical protein